MTAIGKIKVELSKLGYGLNSVAKNYQFADLLSEDAPVREVSLAAFTDTPFSYRNAAFGVINSTENPSADILSRRALGATIWLCITNGQVEVWNTENNREPRRTNVRPISELAELFEENKDDWVPDRIHSAKQAGLWDAPKQLSLVDYDLLRSIEHCAQSHLDRVIKDTLKALIPTENSQSADYRKAYRTCFYFLAAKILQDRKHSVSKNWDSDDAESVLSTINSHYKLEYKTEQSRPVKKARLTKAWSLLKDEVSFANISVDDLAFVYENTLVSPETRKQLGTHSTPRAVGEFLVSRLQLNKNGISTPKIYEPFCGSGVLLVAALSALRGNLPRNWTDAKRHAFLVKNLRASDVDPFACEVISLSLVLADYPSANGWDIQQADLFSESNMDSQLEPGMIILCNPPFEAFTPEERELYPEAISTSVHKPISVLKKVLASKPEAIGFVLPHAVIMDRQYAELRKDLEKYFEEIELIALPDRVFVESVVESALLVAKTPRRDNVLGKSCLSSATIKDDNRDAFLQGTYYPDFRHHLKVPSSKSYDGSLWVSEFSELWSYLETYPRLNSIVELHRGIEWQSGHQTHATSNTKKKNFRLGLHTSKNLLQFSSPQTVYLDCRIEFQRGGALQLPWEQPKVVLNAARKSRGTWRLAASVDRYGWVLSQQLIGCWIKNGNMKMLNVVEAILNSPISAAFVSGINSRKRFNLKTIEQIPIPRNIDIERIVFLVDELRDLFQSFELLTPDRDIKIENAILSLDAEILSAYNLPAKLERELLVHFKSDKRPVAGIFRGYPVSSIGMARSLEECLKGKFDKNKGDWVQKVFQPLPKSELDEVISFL